MSISDQIFAKHCQKEKVVPGEIVECEIDLVMVHEQLGGRIAPEFEKTGQSKIWDPSKVFYILDHWVPAPDIEAAKMHQRADQFAHKYHFKHMMGQNKGICHQVLPELGFAKPGDLIVGSDSHTTTYGAFNCLGLGIGATDVVMVFSTGKLWFKIPETYRFNFLGKLTQNSMTKDLALWLLKQHQTDGFIYDALEFGGSGLKNISVDGRMTLANMSVEMGAKTGVFEFDSRVEKWLNLHPRASNSSEPLYPIKPSSNAMYSDTYEIDMNQIIPMVAKPHSPDNVIPVEELDKIEIDQAFLGSCTNGRIEDLRVAAYLLKGEVIPQHLQFIIIPASREIYQQALLEGLIEIFLKAGAMVEYPSCGPCIGGHLGVLGPGEVCVSTTNRNFQGRMGDPTAQTYLASPAVVTASALKGYITIPSKPIEVILNV